MDDNLLRSLMRDEVPEPGPGYWDKINATLNQATADAAKSGSPRPDEGSGETDAAVIRLRDMNSSSSFPTRKRWSLAAAAIVVLLAIGAATITYLSRESNAVSTNDITNEPDQSLTTDDAVIQDPEPTPGQTPVPIPDEVPDNTDSSLTPTEDVSDPSAPGCYRSDDPEGGGFVALYFLPPDDGRPAVGYRYENTDGMITMRRSVGQLLSNQRYRLVEDGTSEGGLGLGTQVWAITPDALLNERPGTTTNAVPCADMQIVVDELTAFGDTLAAPSFDSITPDGVSPILAPGRYCYVDRAASPLRDLFRVDVADDNTVATEARGWSEDPGFFPVLSETGTGEFLDDRSIWLGLTIDFNGQIERSADLFVVEPGKLFVSPSRFENDQVDCAAVDWAFNDDGAKPFYAHDEVLVDVGRGQPTTVAQQLGSGEAARYQFTLEEDKPLTILTSPTTDAVRYLLTDPDGATLHVTHADGISEIESQTPLQAGQVASAGTYQLIIQAIYGPAAFTVTIDSGP